MKNKVVITVTIGIMCLILTAVIYIQFKTVEETDITSIETMRESELRAELASWKTKYEDALKKYTEDTTMIEEYRQTEQDNQETSLLLAKELDKANLLLGKTNVKGKGIVVTLSDNELKDIESYDLVKLVNELRLAGAEAISINDERVIARTDIVTVNSTNILVNSKRIYSPYIIKAIGNQSYLESGLITKDYGFIDQTIRGNKKTGSVERQDNIEILKYSNKLELKYAEEVKK